MSGMLCLSGFAACLNLHLQIQPSSTVAMLCSSLPAAHLRCSTASEVFLRERLRERVRSRRHSRCCSRSAPAPSASCSSARIGQPKQAASIPCMQTVLKASPKGHRLAHRSRIVAANASAHATCKPSIANGHICLEGPYATAHMVETWDSIVMSHLQHLRQQRGTLVANVVAAQVQPPHARVACACRCANP